MISFDRKKLYLFFYPLVIAEEIFRRSHYCDFSFFRYLCFAVLAIACLFAALKLGLDVYQRKISSRNLLVICVGFLYFAFLLLRKQTDAVMVLWLFIAAGHDVNYGSQLKAAAFSMIVSVFVVALSSLSGVIDNTSTIRIRDNIEYTRSGLGFREAYQISYFTFFSMLAWFGSRRSEVSWIEIVIWLFLAFAIYKQSDTRGPFYLSVLIIVLVAIVKLLPFNAKYFSVFCNVAVLVPFVCASLVVFQGIFLDSNSSEFLRELNMKLTYRLQLNHGAVQEYGITLLGTSIDWNIDVTPYQSYNWVDSVYLYSLLSYGIPFLAGFLAISVKLAIDAGKKKDTYMLLALFAIALLGLWDNYCFRVECNPFFLFLAYEVYQPEKAVHHECLEIGDSHEIR